MSQLESMMINEEDPVREYHKQHECVHFLLNPESMNYEIGLELREQMPEKCTKVHFSNSH